jgi:SAM-dependent methyltransferase
VTLNDPDVVAGQYATEDGLLARRSTYDEAVYEDGRGPLDVMFSSIEEVSPRRVLEVGCGPGEAAERIAAELGAEVIALDISPRMVELARARGVDARVGDVQELPFADASFDCALAAWMLFHVPDLDRALAELHRVLVPGGHLVAVTISESHLSEARELAGIDMRGRVSFSRENGGRSLNRHFDSVELRAVDGWVNLHADAVRSHIGSMITMSERAALIPDFEGSLRAGTRVGIFVAEKTV